MKVRELISDLEQIDKDSEVYMWIAETNSKSRIHSIMYFVIEREVYLSSEAPDETNQHE